MTQIRKKKKKLTLPNTITASLVAQMVKNLPAMQETRIRSLGQEDPLEEEMATPPVFSPGKSLDREA